MDIEEQFVEQEVQALADKRFVSAVAVVGSYARDPAGDHNDIDLFIVVDGDWRKRETVRKDGIVVEYFYNSLDWAKSYLEEDDWHLNYHWFVNADVRHDPDGLFNKLQKYAEEKKDDKLEVGEARQDELRYYLWDKQQDIEQATGGQQIYLMDRFFDWLVRQYYILQGEVPVKDNYRIDRLSAVDQGMAAAVEAYLNAETGSDRKEALAAVRDAVVDIVGEPSPEWKTDRQQFPGDVE